MFALAEVANHPPSGWTDKEVILYVLGAVGGTLVVIVPIAWGLVQLLTSGARRRVRAMEAENRSLKAAKDGTSGEDLQQQLIEATTKVKHLESRLADAHTQAAGFEQAAKGLEGERDELQRELDEANERVEAEQRRVRKAVQKDGVTWTEKVLSSAPEFKPLEPEGRQTPVISLLNLKGGVGKTTATANLGAALAARGWRVLFIDLDLQGSLTSLFLSDSQQEELYKEKRLLGDFLDASFDAEFPNILDYAVPVLPGSKSMLVPTTDVMAYAETNLTLRWFLKESRRDPRFLLRRELHLKRVTDRFDVVLLDCPPFINVNCVNALAASDYVLVPVLPSKQATDRVTILIQRLKEFHDNLNTDLRVMGFFGNRTKESELTSDERNRLSALRDRCKDTWAAAPCFDAFIRQSAEVRRAEDERRPLGAGDELHSAFLRLAEEVEYRLPMFCRVAKGAPAQKEAAL
jgi:chromosome partitioning protein